jgi:hypothetical protein
MKTVMNSSQVAHVWVSHNTGRTEQSNARNANQSFWFNYGVLYSYRTPIAKFHKDAHGKDVVLYTCETYSMTTSSKHMPAMRRAFSPSHSVYCVPAIGTNGGMNRDQYDDDRMHKANADWLMANYNERVSRLMRARSLPDWLGDTYGLGDLFDTLDGYCHAFGLKTPAVKHGTVDCAVIAIREAYAARNTPEQLAKRAADAVKRAAQKEAREERQAIQAAIDLQEDKAEWEAGRMRVFYQWPNRNGVLLRLTADGETVETSQGASVPLAHAIKAFRFARLCRDNKTTWQRNGKTIRVGQFQVDSIDANGNMHAGCHYLRYDIVEAFAHKIGAWEQTAPALAD